MTNMEVLIFWCLESFRGNNLAFWCWAKSAGLFPPTLDPARMEWAFWDKPLSTTTEHLELIKTYLYTPRNSHISTIHLQSCIRRKQRPTDTDRQEEILFSMYDWVNMELHHHFGKTLKGNIFSIRHFWNIKISKPHYVPFPKWSDFAIFVNWTPVTEKLHLTVFLDHPVVIWTMCFHDEIEAPSTKIPPKIPQSVVRWMS